MGIRETLQEKPLVGAIIVIAIVGGIIGIRMAGSAGGVEPGSRFYMDLTTGEIVAYKAENDLPPLTLPTGNQGVMVHMFTCGDCESDEQFVGYMERFTEQYKKAATAAPTADGGPLLTPTQGHHVGVKPEDGGDIRWAEMASPQGANIMRAARQRCDGGATECFPQ